MGLQLSTTGSVSQDISNIIDGMNTLNDSDSIDNALTINAYGELQIDVPNTPNTQSTETFLHNLGYAPLFIVKVISISDTNYDTPILPDAYFYFTGPQSQGAYPYDFIDASIDEQNLYVSVTNLANPAGGILTGFVTFSYYLFTRPIHG